MIGRQILGNHGIAATHQILAIDIQMTYWCTVVVDTPVIIYRHTRQMLDHILYRAVVSLAKTGNRIEQRVAMLGDFIGSDNNFLQRFFFNGFSLFHGCLRLHTQTNLHQKKNNPYKEPTHHRIVSLHYFHNYISLETS